MPLEAPVTRAVLPLSKVMIEDYEFKLFDSFLCLF
jgi:hypothetical protein